jgi:predicted transcriptional regulator
MDITLKSKASTLRESGLTYKQIGEMLGKSGTTINKWLNPKYHQKQNQRRTAYKLLGDNFFKHKLQASKSEAKKRGHIACNATVEQLKKTHTDICEICKKKCKTVMDHCHNTGDFRGWICAKCNWVLGQIETHPQYLQYLNRKS